MEPIVPSTALVTFTPAGWLPPEEDPEATPPRVMLDKSPITRRGGLVPDRFTFVVAQSELAKLGLGEVSIEVAGIIELWYTSAPGAGAADVTIGNVAIVDVEPNLIGRKLGDSDDSTISYLVCIADHRRAWVAPRGGVLFDGTINPEPDPLEETPLTCSELIGKCTTALGVVATIDGDVDEVEAPRNVQWDGAHAPSELQRLLEHSGTVFAPLLSGQAQIVRPGTVEPPTIPGDRLIRNVLCSCIDRRSGIAVFTSCPAPKIRSFNDEGSTVPTWKYVAQDATTGDWLPLSELSDIGGDAAAAWSNDFEEVDEPLRAHYRSQVYRCIQIDKTKYLPRRVRLLTQFLDVDLSRMPPSFKHADLLTRVRDLTFAKVEGAVRAVKIIPEANVLIFEHPLMKIGSGTQTRRPTLNAGVICIPEDALKPTFSVEAWDDSTHSREYGVYGASVSGGFVSGISAATAKTYTKGFRPNVSIFHAPDLLNVVLNGGTTTDDRNTEDMQDRAEIYAAGVFGAATPGVRVITVKGFYAVEIDACVSEVTYDPRRVTTTIVCNGWHITARAGGGLN